MSLSFHCFVVFLLVFFCFLNDVFKMITQTITQSKCTVVIKNTDSIFFPQIDRKMIHFFLSFTEEKNFPYNHYLILK